MIGWLCLPLALSVLFGLAAPSLARRLPPAQGTWLLSGGGALAASASSASLGLLAFLFLAQTPLAADAGQWSKAVLRGGSGVPVALGATACLLVVVLATRFVCSVVSRVSAIRAAGRLAAMFPARGAELAVIYSTSRQALAVPGRPGRIVVTTGMLGALDAGQRRALLAHERAHLARHHHWHQSAAALAVAVNPLLRRLPAALELTCERWADEDAAAESSRVTVAGALARAATGSRRETNMARSAVVLAAVAGDVAARIGALHSPAPRADRWRLGMLSVLLTAIAVAVAVALRDVEGLFERAQAVYRATH